MKEYQIIMRRDIYQKIRDISVSRNISDKELKEKILSHIRLYLKRILISEGYSHNKQEKLKNEIDKLKESNINVLTRQEWIYEDEVKFNVLMPEGLYDENKNYLNNFSVLSIVNE